MRRIRFKLPDPDANIAKDPNWLLRITVSTVQDTCTSTLRMGLTYRCEDAAGLTQSLVASQQAGQEVLGQLGVLTHKQPE